MATRSIGSSGRDHSTVADWISYLAGIGTLTEDEIGELYADSEFAVAGQIANFTGFTASSGARAILRPASGQGFRDHASAASNPLKYDATKGVALRTTSGFTTCISIGVDWVELDGLQIELDSGDGFQALDMNSTSLNNVVVKNCIIDRKQGDGSGVIRARSGQFENLLLIQRGGGNGVNMPFPSAMTWKNVGVVRPSDLSTAGNAWDNDAFGTTTLINCYSFNFTNMVDSAGNFAGSNNGADVAIGFGSSNQASLTFADQFEGTAVASMDFRLKTGAALINNGTASGVPATDIIGQSRDGATDIGPWEFQSGAPPAGSALLPILLAH